MAQNNTGAPILEVRNLKKYFKVKKGLLHAVDDINFTIERGKTLGVVGESGCGKSTLGRTILRLTEPTSGEILFEGKDISRYGKAQMRKMREDMQIIFQDPYASINPRMSVSQIIREPMLVTHKFADAAQRPGAPPVQRISARTGRRPPPAHRHCARAGAGSEVHRMR